MVEENKYFANGFHGKTVLVTGHTGFKGSWLCEWLIAEGANVVGFSLPDIKSDSLFDRLKLEWRLTHLAGDVRDRLAVRNAVESCQPQFVFHLAAQSLVGASYESPVETYATNVMGTVNLLDAIRVTRNPCSVIIVTTDKCYENREWVHSYREEDPLGGFDPYSSSKGAAELVTSAYRRSYFQNSSIRVASVRAGNVIGGGDWAPDRILPDCIRALQQGRDVLVRNKVATRPWQHVLEPISGYLWLAACLADERLSRFGLQVASCFNFGPRITSNRTVAELVNEVLKHWPGGWEDKSDPHAVHEARLLNLSTDKAYHLLGWEPVWDFPQTVAETVKWYKAEFRTAADVREYTLGQISKYCLDASARKAVWAQPHHYKSLSKRFSDVAGTDS